MKQILVMMISLTAAVGVCGCATQADLQAEQRERESMRRQFADNKVGVDEVRREIEEVRGEIEEVRNRLDRVAKERVNATPQMKLVEDRLAALERQVRLMQSHVPPTVIGSGNVAPPGGVPPPPGTPGENPLIVGDAVPPTNPPSGTPTPPTDGGVDLALSKEPPGAQEEYRSALKAMRDQDYNRAVQQFRNFQRQNAGSPMADDAQYWIGESYFVQKDYNRAILEFNDVLKYRRGDKVPAALLRQAQAFVEIGDTIDARLILQKLVNDHPNSEQAAAAKEILPTLGR